MPPPARRPRRLHRVEVAVRRCHRAALAGRDVDRPDLVVAARPVGGVGERTRGHRDLAAVGGPGRVVAEVGQPPHRLAGRAHDEDPAPVSLGPERDRLAVRREGGLVVVGRGVGGQVLGIAPADPQEEDVEALPGLGGVDDALPVGGDRGLLLDAGLVGELDEGGGGRPRRGRGAGALRQPPRNEPGERPERDESGGRPDRAQAPLRGRLGDPLVPDLAVAEAREVESQVARRLETLLGPLLEAVPDDPRERRRQPLDRRGEIGGLLAQDRRHRLRARLAREGPSARQHLVEHRPEREDVGARVGGLAAHLLGRHVADRSQDRARLRRARGGRRAGLAAVAPAAFPFREAEVEDLQPALPGDEDVLRLQVAVDDPLVVRGGQGLGQLHRVLHGLAHGQGARRQPLPQRLALEQLHDGVGRPGLAAEVVDREDARVRQRRHGFRLPLEAGEGLLVLREARGEDLDRHLAVELGVASAKDLAHPPGAEGGGDLVGSETLAGCQGQRESPIGRVIPRSLVSPCDEESAGPPADPSSPGAEEAPRGDKVTAACAACRGPRAACRRATRRLPTTPRRCGPRSRAALPPRPRARPPCG